MRVLLVAGSPEPSSAATLSELAREAETIVAIDRGAEACRAAGIAPDAFCGDADTVSADTLAGYATTRAPRLRPPPASTST